jgi:hypothetical protein
MGLPNDQIATAFRKSGKTQDAFCAGHAMTIHKLRYYLYKKGVRQHTRTVKTRLAAASAISAAAPSGFISFNRHPGDDCTKRQPVTIITGHFSIAEVAALMAKTGAATC